MEKEKIYLAGAFSDWRDKIIQSLPKFQFADPRNNRQNAVAKLVEDDMNNACQCPILFGCFPEGHARGTMTYAEIGASKVSGNYIIIVDENKEKDGLIKEVASEELNSLEEGIEFLRGKDYVFIPSKQIRVKKEKAKGLDILLVGDTAKIEKLDVDGKGIEKRIKTIPAGKYWTSEKDFEEIDLMIVNFPRGARDKKAVFYMGICYTLDIPIIMVESNPIVYPPLGGLAKRVFVGPEREIILQDYLSQLDSIEIEKEAPVMYNLFKKYDS